MYVHSFSPFYMWLFVTWFENNGTKKDERKHHDLLNKSPSKQQVCVTDSKHLFCAKIGPIHLVLVGLTAGKLAVHQTILKIFKIR